MEINYIGKRVYLCEICGFGYKEEIDANDCEGYCRTHKSTSAKIAKRAAVIPEQI